MITGVNKQILDRLGDLDAVPEYPSNEWNDALGSLDEHKRRKSTLSLIGKIWNAHPGLGPSPVLEILYTDEEEKKLYDSYRDHIVHSLQVYILGLDIFHGLPDLRRQLEGTSGFAALKRRWAIAALAHDQGYIFTSRREGNTPESLKRLLQNPLLGVHNADRGWIEDFDRYHKFVPGQIGFLQNLLTFDGHDILSELEAHIPPSVLGPTATPLTAFYNFSLQTGFFAHDHGIVSALLLEQLHRRLRALLGSVDWTAVPHHHDRLRAMHKHLETAFPDVTEAAVAMALHNVNSRLRGEHLDQAQALQQLDIRHFRLTLRDTPLAWFLAFCDVLQCWNRPVIVQKADAVPNSIEPEGVCISYDGAHMWLSFANEETELQAAKPSPYWVMRRQLAAQLNEGDLAFLLEGQCPEAVAVSVHTEPGRTPHLKGTDTRNYAIMGELSWETITKDELEFRVKSQPRKYPEHEPVCVLYTGGSVGMVPKDPLDPKSPLETEKLHRVVPYLTNLKRLEFDVDFYETPHPLDSSNILPRDWIEIGNLITALYRYYQGFVVLHGTDTMTYTAAALSFMFSNLRKPIILTGAERPISEPETDAEHNLMRALRLAAPSRLENEGVPEVCIFFGNRLLRGNRAKKTHALDFNGFDSPNSPHLGKVEDKITIDWRNVRDAILKRPRAFEMQFDPHLDERVAIYEIFPGLASCIEPLKYMLLESTAVQGLILKTYGTGNAPSDPEEFLQILREAIWKKGKIIINLTQCQTGEVEVRLFETNARLFEAGVVNGGDMTSEAAYAKLMVLMGRHKRKDHKGEVSFDYDAIKNQIQRDMRGELRLSAHTLVYPDAMSDAISFGPGRFHGTAKDLGIPVDDQVNRAYIRVANIEAHAKTGAQFKIAVCVNLPADCPDDITKIDPKHIIDVVERKWEGKRLTFNVDATERVKNFVGHDVQLSMQLVPIEPMTFTFETFELSVFTENLKG